MCISNLDTSLSLQRAFCRITLIINQQMHYIKFHIKTLKIALTCFDPKIILRELHCSLLKPFSKHSHNNSIILTGCCGSISCCVRVRCWECVWLWCASCERVSHYITHDTHHSQTHSQQRTLTQHDMLPQHPVKNNGIIL